MNTDFRIKLNVILQALIYMSNNDSEATSSISLALANVYFLLLFIIIVLLLLYYYIVLLNPNLNFHWYAILSNTHNY